MREFIEVPSAGDSIRGINVHLIVWYEGGTAKGGNVLHFFGGVQMSVTNEQFATIREAIGASGEGDAKTGATAGA